MVFRGVDAETHASVYFRPFNFRAADPDRHKHAVQYVSHPQWPCGHRLQRTQGTVRHRGGPALAGDRSGGADDGHSARCRATPRWCAYGAPGQRRSSLGPDAAASLQRSTRATPRCLGQRRSSFGRDAAASLQRSARAAPRWRARSPPERRSGAARGRRARSAPPTQRSGLSPPGRPGGAALERRSPPGGRTCAPPERSTRTDPGARPPPRRRGHPPPR